MEGRAVSKVELRNRAVRKVANLLKLPRGKRVRQLIYRRRRWRRPFLVEELLASSIPVIRTDPGEARHRLEMATLVVDSHIEDGGSRLDEDTDLCGLRALLDAYRGNLERVERRFAKAEECFEKAHAWLAAGRLHPTGRGLLASLHASLLKDLYQFEAALQRLVEAEEWLRGSPEARLERGKILLNQATVLRLLGQQQRALARTKASCRHFVQAGETTLALRALLSLGRDYCETGDPASALATLAEADALFRQCGDRFLLIHHTWLLGSIHEGQGRPAEAQRCFEAACRNFLEHGQIYDALQVSLDLAGVALSHGNPVQLEKVCHQIERFMEHAQVRPLLHEEGRAALRRFILAAAERGATPELLGRTVAALRSARHAYNR